MNPELEVLIKAFDAYHEAAGVSGGVSLSTFGPMSSDLILGLAMCLGLSGVSVVSAGFG